MGSDFVLPVIQIKTRDGNFIPTLCVLHDGLIIQNVDEGDVEELACLEKRNFSFQQYGSDVLSAKKFLYFLTRANAVTLVARSGSAILGYVIIIFRKNSNIARLYTMAVDRPARGKGLAKKLLQVAEKLAAGFGCAYMSLETRIDNKAMQNLCENSGYQKKNFLKNYYADHGDAYKYVKRLGVQ
ncbi:MAG: GNAT family N-acetyltransferase [Alphaproteobacteria bacterium]|nr:GNAT family N-acetyltransferase [Alphaproteobacteria bacterium]